MLRIRNRWVRIVVVLALLPLISLAAYQIGISIWANRQHRAATQALERYDYWQANIYLQRYLTVWPKDSEALLLAAQTARRQGDFPEAVRRLRQAEQQGVPAFDVDTERELARIQRGDLTNAGQLVHLCKTQPDAPETVLALEVLIEGGLTAFNLPLVKWAVDLWLTHRTARVDQVQGLVWRGRWNELSQNLLQALADYRQAVEMDPEHAQARLRLAEALIREEPWEAAPHLEWLQRHRPADPEVQFQMARLRRNLGQPEEASHLLDAVLVAAPSKVPALVERGRVAMDLNRPADAERWLLQAYSLAPEQREVNLALSDCLRQEGRLDEAKRYQDKVGEIDARLKKMMTEMARPGSEGG